MVSSLESFFLLNIFNVLLKEYIWGHFKLASTSVNLKVSLIITVTDKLFFFNPENCSTITLDQSGCYYLP